MLKLNLLISLFLLLSVSVYGRLYADDVDEYDVYGLELLQNRYGSAYPGYGLNDVNNNFNYGYGGGDFGVGVGSPVGQQFGYSGLAYGAGTKKGQTTVAAPIYTQPMVVPKIITQPILRPHLVTQPILQTQYIQQPIVETRQVIQPVIRRIVTQPIIRPEITETTTIQPQLKTETIVQPHLIEQTLVTPQLQNTMEENAPIQAKPRVQVQQAVVQPTQTKKSAGLGGLNHLF